MNAYHNDPAAHATHYCPKCDEWTYSTRDGECEDCASRSDEVEPELTSDDHVSIGYELRANGRPRSECANFWQGEGWDEADDDIGYEGEDE